MKHDFYNELQAKLNELKEHGLYKSERIIKSKQSAMVNIEPDNEVINFCANNYLGLADSQNLIKDAQEGLEKYGYGVASVRFICGTQSVHKTLEHTISNFLNMEDTILYSSCFDANTGLFETILDKDDAIISDELNHASIIDGVRLCKAARYRYKNNDMKSLEEQLIKAKKSDAKNILVVTDGVFSMDGVIANLKEICDLSEKYNALVMVDDSHAVGFMGENGKGTHEYNDVIGRVDIITGTLGKALGGASGGYTSGKKEVIDWLRQRSRPYLFSNSLAPVIAYTSNKMFQLIESQGSELRKQLNENSNYFRDRMNAAGFNLAGKDHPIIPIMLGDAKLAVKFSEMALTKGIYVIAFSYPVVPKNQARIRTQMSAIHSRKQLDYVIDSFIEIGKELNIIG
ncbi:glycine C-acetyltransferase [Paraphotobacterium marinum]|uniref:2-amino-3-ketobutyrate coenzyme A ligase n=1 Tax=Paraphotobacterium marinum TaxID=1755811 RepID=A0A220VCM5_9GAMM|nr:glycine C-acetyltransferase [Paraphotobacterium marinum]ASK78050.1 glycine C-acetyltransferase [Paraphotobacterium marinum]